MRTTRKELNMFVDEEICPGVTYLQHAEGVARFNLRSVDYNEIQFRAEVLKVLEEIQPDLTEMELLVLSLEQLKNGEVVDL